MVETWCWKKNHLFVSHQARTVAERQGGQIVMSNQERFIDIHDSCFFSPVKLKQSHDEMYDTAHIYIGISYGGG